jgi:S-DNA-T family DNA segregation ATPase FtsK/SpoIIIE
MNVLTRRRERQLDEAEVDRLVWAWRLACIGAGIHTVVQTASGPTESVPRIVDIVLGPPLRFVVQLLPGQLAADLRAVGHRVAGHLGARVVQVQALGLQHVSVQLLDRDPLDGVLSLDLTGAPGDVLIGVGEDGLEIGQDWTRAAHTVVQGVTRSGKSVWTYGLLAQLARRPDVVIAGLDPTGLLWRPFAGSRHADWQRSGLVDLAAHEDLLARLVADMDARIADLPEDRDTIEISVEQPLRLVVLEEYAGELRAIDAVDKDRGKRVRALISRLLAEGAKVGIRVLLLVQRAEAAVIGAFERAMCSTRISFRVDNRASVELLHPGTPGDLADAHTTAVAGVALLSTPGAELRRFRAPLIGEYRDYVIAIRTACRTGD